MTDFQVAGQVRLKQVFDILSIHGDEVIVDMDGAERKFHKSQLVSAIQNLMPGDFVVKSGRVGDTVVQVESASRAYSGLFFVTSENKNAYWDGEIVRFATKEERAEFFQERKKMLQDQCDAHLAHIDQEIKEKNAEKQKMIDDVQAMIDRIDRETK